MSPVAIIGSLQEFHDTISAPKKTLIFYTKSWCPWCSKLKPTIEEALASTNFRDVVFRMVVLDKHETSEQQWLKPEPGVPQVHLFESGNQISEQNGYMEREVFTAWLSNAIKTNYPHNTVGISKTLFDDGADSCQLVNNRTGPAQPMCIGKFEDRRKRTILFTKNRKAFSDLEPGCVFKPTEDDQGVLIGRANDDASYFDLILWNVPHNTEGKVYFSIDFMPDPVKKARFESAMFSVTFGSDSGDGKHTPMMIRDLYPVNAEDMAVRPLLTGQLVDAPAAEEGVDDAASFVSSLDSVTTTSGSSTSTVMTGQGLHSPTAVWNLSAEKGAMARYGLETHYDMYAAVSTTGRVWMKFWAKAVLVSGDETGLSLKRTTTLKIGTVEQPYERVLDLRDMIEPMTKAA